MRKYTQEEKRSAIARYAVSKESVSEILADTGIPKSTFYGWLENERKASAYDTSYFCAANYHRLRHHAEHMEKVISCLKEVNCPPNAPLKEKLPEAERLYGNYSVHVLCDALSISRGTFYNHMRRSKGDNAWFARRREELKPLIQDVYDESEQRFGYDSIAAVLRSRGITVSNKYVRELGREMGLFSIRNDSRLYYEQNNKGHKNRVKHQFNPDSPNKVWVSDVTYYKLKGKHYYICVILDLYSRMVIACKVSKRNSSALVKMAIKEAYSKRNPEKGLILHNDRGINYQSEAVEKYIAKLGILHSFSAPYTPHDNAVMESFFSTLKREELYRRDYRSEREFLEALKNYVSFYNNKRPIKMFQYRTPEKRESEYYSKHKASR